MKSNDIKTKVLYSFEMGALCSPVGIACGLLVLLFASGEGYLIFPLYAGIAAFLTSAFLWFIFVALTGQYNKVVGGLIGGLSGILAHWLCWYFLLIVEFLINPERGVDWIGSIGAAMMLTIGSLIFFGWITLPAGVIIGVLVGGAQRSRKSWFSRDN